VNQGRFKARIDLRTQPPDVHVDQIGERIEALIQNCVDGVRLFAQTSGDEARHPGLVFRQQNPHASLVPLITL
jgi:hypothetical protein